MKNSYGRTIFVTAAITVVSIIACIVFAVTLIFTLSPGRAGDFVYSIGMTNWASTLYHKEYTYSGSVSRLYQALNVAITNDKYSRVVEYYEEFKLDEDFDEFVDYKIDSAKSQNVSALIKAGLLNEREYLEKNYVKALVNIGKSVQAFTYSLAGYDVNDTYTLEDTGYYTFQYFTDKALFDYVELDNDMSLKDNLIIYLDTIYGIFDTNKTTTDELKQAYLIVLGQKIVTVSEHINSLLDSTSADRITTNNGYITSVNTVLQGLIAN